MRARVESYTGRTLEESYTGLTVNLLLAIPTLHADDRSRSARKRRTEQGGGRDDD